MVCAISSSIWGALLTVSCIWGGVCAICTRTMAMVSPRNSCIKFYYKFKNSECQPSWIMLFDNARLPTKSPWWPEVWVHISRHVIDLTRSLLYDALWPSSTVYCDRTGQTLCSTEHSCDSLSCFEQKIKQNVHRWNVLSCPQSKCFNCVHTNAELSWMTKIEPWGQTPQLGN